MNKPQGKTDLGVYTSLILPQHPQYSGSSAGFPNDIAVLELSSPIPLGSTIALATLASNNEDFLSGTQNCWITGWGRTNVGSKMPRFLQ